MASVSAMDLEDAVRMSEDEMVSQAFIEMGSLALPNVLIVLPYHSQSILIITSLHLHLSFSLTVPRPVSSLIFRYPETLLFTSFYILWRNLALHRFLYTPTV
jgi:hypothetical protein